MKWNFKIEELNDNQLLYLVSTFVGLHSFKHVMENISKETDGYKFLEYVRDIVMNSSDNKYAVIHGGVIFFKDNKISLETLMEDICSSLEPEMREYMGSRIMEDVETLNNCNYIWNNGIKYDFGVIAVGYLATGFDNLEYVRSCRLWNGVMYVFAGKDPDETTWSEIAEADRDFATRCEMSNDINTIIRLWENMEIGNPYDPFLDFTRYLYYRHIESEEVHEDYMKYLCLYKFCKELISSKAVPSLNDKMRKIIFIEGDEMTMMDRATSISCSISELYKAFTVYANERSSELSLTIDHIASVGCVYQHCKISGVDMLLRPCKEIQCDMVKVPEKCGLGYRQIAQAIYDGRNPKYIYDDPEDEDSNYTVVYKNPDDIIPEIN